MCCSVGHYGHKFELINAGHLEIYCNFRSTALLQAEKRNCILWPCHILPFTALQAGLVWVFVVGSRCFIGGVLFGGIFFPPSLNLTAAGFFMMLGSS